VWVTRFLFTAGMWMVQPFIQYYLRDVIGSPRPAEDAGRIIGVALVGATLTGLLGGAISDRVGRKRVVYVANGLMAAVSLGFMAVGTLPAVYVTAVLYGLAFGAYYSVDWALGCDVLPRKDEAGKDMGVWHISMVLPQSLAPFLSGLLLTLGGASSRAGWAEPHYHASGYVMLFALAAVLLTLSAVLLKNVRGVR
jgi:MFS family permease